MNYYAFTGFNNFFIGAVCAGIVFFNNPLNHKNRIFALHSLNLALWSFFYGLWQISETEAAALFFIRAFMMFAIFIPVFFFHHVMTLFETETPFAKKLLRWCYILGVFLCLTNFTPLMVKAVEPRLGFPFWPIPGLFLHIQMVFLAVPIVYSVYLIWTMRAKASPVDRNKLSWLLFGTFFAYGGGLMNYPLWYKIPIPPVGNVTCFILVLTSAMLFFRLGFFDLRLFIRNALLHLIITVPVGIIFYFLASSVFDWRYTLALFLIFAISMPLIYGGLMPIIKRLLAKLHLDPTAEYIKHLSDSMVKIRESSYTYNDLARNIVQSTLTTLPLTMAAVYIYDNQSQSYRLCSQQGMKNPLSNDLHFNRSQLAIEKSDSLIKQLNQGRITLLRDELLQKKDQPEVQNALETMERLEAVMTSPIFLSGQIRGLLVLGPKKNQQMFNEEDTMALRSMTQMVEDIMRYIVGMETELQHTALYSHDMANDVRSLMETIRFLLSPLAQINLTDRLRSLVERAKMVAEGLHHTLETNRDRSSLIMKSLRGEYEKMPVPLIPLIRRSFEKFELLSKNKNVILTCELPSAEEIFVNGHPDDLLRVVDNLISNALRHVPENGTIEITGQKLNRTFEFKVKDNGEGINPDEIGRIWGIGWQGKKSKKGSAGLGLSIVRQIVQLHDGSITAISEGAGTGTSFLVTLPLMETAAGEKN